MRYAVVDCRISENALAGLDRCGFFPILMPPSESLDAQVASHPDMLVFFGDAIFCHAEYAKTAKRELELISHLTGLGIVVSHEPTGKKYPSDILFNAARVGKNIFCRKDAVSELIVRYAERASLTLVPVRQGYAECSVCRVSDGAIVTSDAGIAKAARERKIRVLEISPGGVGLEGCCGGGFIGGASGLDGDRVYFCGDPESHPEGDRIIDFCRSEGKEPIALSSDPLYDIGTIFFI